MKKMGLSGETPLGEAKTKAPNSDYHKDEPPAATRQAEAARDYLKRAARIDELNGRPPGSDGQMVAALKRYNGGRVLVFVMGAFAEMPGDVSRICGADPRLVLQRPLAPLYPLPPKTTFIFIPLKNPGSKNKIEKCSQNTINHVHKNPVLQHRSLNPRGA